MASLNRSRPNNPFLNESVPWQVPQHNMKQIVEGVADVLIGMIPLYSLAKMGFLIWCYSPSTKGAKIVYESVIKPFIVPALGLDGAKNKGE